MEKENGLTTEQETANKEITQLSNSDLDNVVGGCTTRDRFQDGYINNQGKYITSPPPYFICIDEDTN
ncbi:MAG: hypothetical protein MJ247_01265 [Alphaproteobacteria bacterium]|nr:hypothetical protein [Alphaproteobacteria bacterium]